MIRRIESDQQCLLDAARFSGFFRQLSDFKAGLTEAGRGTYNHRSINNGQIFSARGGAAR